VLHPVAHTIVALCENCMDAPVDSSHHPPVRVLAHIKRLDDCYCRAKEGVAGAGSSRRLQPTAATLFA